MSRRQSRMSQADTSTDVDGQRGLHRLCTVRRSVVTPSYRVTTRDAAFGGLPRELRAHEWTDSTSVVPLFATRSRYVERIWLPALGPTPLLALRILGELIDASESGVAAIETEVLAVSLGLGQGLGENSSLARALRRLERFDLAKRADQTTYFVRTEVPPISDRDAAQLPTLLKDLNARLLATRAS
jgi:hypothetical protein